MIDSPCKDVCVTDSETGLCVGCSRTQEEIANWIMYSDIQKKQVLSDIEVRNKNC
jgi:uncharacterized protein